MATVLQIKRHPRQWRNRPTTTKIQPRRRPPPAAASRHCHRPLPRTLMWHCCQNPTVPPRRQWESPKPIERGARRTMLKWLPISWPRQNPWRLSIRSCPLLPQHHPPITTIATMATRSETRKQPQLMRKRLGTWNRQRMTMPPSWETEGGSGTTVDTSIVVIIIATYPRVNNNGCRMPSHHRGGAASNQNKSAMQINGRHL
mmetsp:Transcript_19294/g.40404  ORF Transcript_19294/g.40404 Transcript_19294/m.40404 type:complete len:201 (-) Transcript_19294:567-1169(-)